MWFLMFNNPWVPFVVVIYLRVLVWHSLFLNLASGTIPIIFPVWKILKNELYFLSNMWIHAHVTFKENAFAILQLVNNPNLFHVLNLLSGVYEDCFWFLKVFSCSHGIMKCLREDSYWATCWSFVDK